MKRTPLAVLLVAAHVVVAGCSPAQGGSCIDTSGGNGNDKDGGAGSDGGGKSPEDDSGTPPPTTDPPASKSCGAIKLGDPTCQTCLESNCCAIAKSCSDSPKCLAFGQCASLCRSDINCLSKCYYASPTGYDQYAAVVECMQDRCPACVK